jgi:ubiquitin-conjugating enzyme E2 G1
MNARVGTDSPGGGSSAALLLGRQFKQMQTDKDIPGISCGLVGNSVFEWEVMLMLSDDQDSLYGGAWPCSFPPPEK